MPRLRACLLAACLVSSAFAESLTLAMAHLRDHDDGFDPHEPPTHTTDVKVGVYLEHLLDVSMEEHTFDMDFYFTCCPALTCIVHPNPDPNVNPCPNPNANPNQA